MSKYRETIREDWIRTVVYLILFIVTVLTGAIFLMPAYWYFWLILVAVGLFLLARWHAKTFAYRCPRCGYEFETSTFADFTGPQSIGKSGGWKYLKCPKCQQRSRAIVIKKIKQ